MDNLNFGVRDNVNVDTPSGWQDRTSTDQVRVFDRGHPARHHALTGGPQATPLTPSSGTRCCRHPLTSPCLPAQ